MWVAHARCLESPYPVLASRRRRLERQHEHELAHLPRVGRVLTPGVVISLNCRESDVARWPSPSRGLSSAAHWQVWCRSRHQICRLAPSPIRGVASGWLGAAVRCGQSSGSVAVLVAAVEMSVSASRVSAVAGRQCGGPRSGGGTEGAAAGSFPRARPRHLGVAGGDVRGGVAVVAVA